MSYFDHFAQPPTTKIGDWITAHTKCLEFRVIRGSLPNPTPAILEIGPGNGELASLFLQNGYTNYTAVEPNETMRWKLTAMGVATNNYLIPNLQEPDCAFDVLILEDVFEHLGSTEAAGVFMSSAWRVLKTGGILCIVSPDYLHWKEDFFNADFTHNHVTTVRRALQMFYDAGFDVRYWTYLTAFFSGILSTLVSHLSRIGFFLPGETASTASSTS